MIQGIDVYSGQGPSIDWAAVKAAGYSFACIKATEGLGYVNPYLAQQVAGARAAALVIIFYHFGRPSQASGHAEADFFLTTVGGVVGGWQTGEGAALDLEDTDVPADADLDAYVLDWGGRVTSALNNPESLAAGKGLRPFLYSGHWYLQPHNLERDPRLAAYPLWDASYQATLPPCPTPWTTIALWQYDDHGRVPGIPGEVDLDTFEGTLDELRASGWPAYVPPAPTPRLPTPDVDPASQDLETILKHVYGLLADASKAELARADLAAAIDHFFGLLGA